MTSETSICNSALIKIGAPRIASLSEVSKSAQLCNEQYAKIRDQVLCAHPWSFAISRASIAQIATTPLFDFLYSFQLPSNCLRVLNVQDPNITYKIEGNQLLSNESSILIRYISQVTDPAQFAASFITALEFRLAAELSYAIVQNATLSKTMYDAYKAELAEARSVNSQGSGTPDPVWDNDWLIARY